MTNTDLKPLARDVLMAYQNKDIGYFENIFSENVVLRDWNSEVCGKEKAVAEFARNFSDAQTLSIRVLQILDSGLAVAAEVEILVNGELLRVVDVITFTSDKQISSIVAYIGL